MWAGPQWGIIFTINMENCGQLGLIASIWFSTFRSGLTHFSNAVRQFGNKLYFSYLFCIPFLMVWWILCTCCYDARKHKSDLRYHAIRNVYIRFQIFETFEALWPQSAAETKLVFTRDIPTTSVPPSPPRLSKTIHHQHHRPRHTNLNIPCLKCKCFAKQGFGNTNICHFSPVCVSWDS